MLDITLIRTDPERVQTALAKRGVQVDLHGFLALDTDYRDAVTRTEQARADRKRISAQIGATLREPGGGNVAALREQAEALGKQIAVAEAELDTLRQARSAFLDGLPNLPDDDVVAGGKQNNQVLRTAGQPPRFDFPAADHVALAERLNLIDYQGGARLSGAGFWIYTGDGALLEWALLNYFVDAHRRDGYEFVLPPHLLTYEAGYAAGQFPKFADEVFAIASDTQGRFLLPTSETALVNLHRGQVLAQAELPRRYFAFSPCYRREAGGYRTAERGTLRGHQFHKVEMFAFTSPVDSEAMHAELLDKAEQLVAGLGLHHRVTRLAAEDTSAAMAKTFDVEVWLPSIGGYVEVSSVSNARDYQARRGGIKYRDDGTTRFVHTLNASGLATSRLLPAILEQHQRPDGTVAVPEALHRWFPDPTIQPRHQAGA